MSRIESYVPLSPRSASLLMRQYYYRGFAAASCANAIVRVLRASNSLPSLNGR